MILTITLNSAIDKVLLIDELTPGVPMQAHKMVTSVGGKGLDASVVLHHLGVKTVGLAFLAGKNGEVLLGLLDQYGIETKAIWTQGETREIFVLAESMNKRISHIRLGNLEIIEENRNTFLNTYQKLLSQSDWVICAGSIPPTLPASFCAEMVKRASQADVPFLIDGSRDTIHETLPFKPAVVKMNWEEFEWTFSVKANSLADLVSSSLKVREQKGIQNLVITCGTKGLIALTESAVFYAKAPVQEVINVAGAGDAVSATLTWRLSIGDTWAEALRWSAAAAAAVVLTERTADCRWEDVQKLLPQVVVEKNATFCYQ